MVEVAPTPIDAYPLCGSEEGSPVPWWLADAAAPRVAVIVQLPEPVLVDLLRAQKQLGITASDLVAAWVKRSAQDADNLRRRLLAAIDDHSRIRGWLPSGSAVTRDDA